ncbi:MAG TPA: hypothetical protein VE961_14975 [Pyrinomonadaceae bacterium]|nr:hypothetical protein [Pyrinomonadaceae bacterium]
MKIINYSCLGAATIALLCLPLLSSRSARTPQAYAEPQPSPRATFSFVRYTGNKPFKLNTLPTTPFGPPWADIMSHPRENMLACTSAAPIALCYYSGPSGTTPCTLDGLGIANCTCYEIPAGPHPYFVDINAILNLDVYLKTVQVCGRTGEKCRPTGQIEAPVCEAINRNQLIPGADLISTFSLYLAARKDMSIKLTDCDNQADYAGCMTAPCKRTGATDTTTGLPLVQCGCPVYHGKYQVGTEISQDQCVLGGNQVWSAAYTPKPGG